MNEERTLTYTVNINTFCKEHQVPQVLEQLKRVLNLNFSDVEVREATPSDKGMGFGYVQTIEGDLDGQRRFRPGQRGVVLGRSAEHVWVKFDTHPQPVRFAWHEVQIVG